MKTCLECQSPFKPKRKEQVYCSRSCAGVKKGRRRKGQKTGPQRGRVYKRTLDKDGYVRVYAGLHPYAEGRLMIQEHTAVMEAHIGRRLSRCEVVHHINRDRTDNRLCNLRLMTRSEHSLLHGKDESMERSRGEDGRFV